MPRSVPLAVILDMDGLMLDTEVISRRVWREAAIDLGIVLTDDVADQMVGRNEAGSRALLRAHFGEAFPVEALAVSAQTRYRECLDTNGVPTKPGLEELLDFLDARRIPRAVATSTAHDLARHKLHQAGVLHYFDIVVGGDEVRHGKPDPDIFLMAAARLKHEPATCVVFEDSAPGIHAAAAAGMRPILIPDGREPAEATRQAAYAVLESLTEARVWLEGMMAESGQLY